MKTRILDAALVLLALLLCACDTQDVAPAGEDVSLHICPPCPNCGSKPAAAGDSGQPGQTPADGPEVSMLFHLADEYMAVKFSHKAHAASTGDCETCHHYHSEVERSPPCRECHGQPFKNLEKPGLKGAYHRQCMLCHRVTGKGPLECEGCHTRRAPGDTVAPVEASRGPDQVSLGHIAKAYPAVKFNHHLHTEMADRCEDCHHHHGDVEKTPPCRECHNTAKAPAGEKKLGLKAAYHKQCLDCHHEKHGPEECEGCHKEPEEEKSE